MRGSASSRGDHIVDVVAAADALHRAVPATSVKIALTSGAQTLAALKESGCGRRKAKLFARSPGVKFLPPIPDPSKFFCVGKNNKKHREELAANKMLTEVPNEPTGFIKLIDTMSGDGDEVTKPADIIKLDYEPELCYVVGKRAHGVKKAEAMDYICRLHADQRRQRARDPAARGGLRQPVLDRQEHAGLWRRSGRTS